MFFNSEDKNLIKRSLIYINPYKKRLMLTISIILFGLILSTLQPYIFGKVIDFITGDSYDTAFNLTMLTFLLMGFGRVCSLIKTIYITVIANNIVSDLRKNLYENILNLPISFFNQRKKGEFISRFESDINTLADILTSRVTSLIVDIFKVIIVGIIVFRINFRMALVLVISFPVSYFLVNSFGKKIRSETSETKNLRDKYLTFFQESLMGIKKIKELKIYNIIERKMFNLQDEFINKNIKKNKVLAYSNFTNVILSVITFIVLLIIGIKNIEYGLLTIGGFVAFNSYSNLFQSSLCSIVNLNSNIHETLISIQRIFEMINKINYQEDNEGVKLKQIEGKINFENISFGYQKENVLENFSVNFFPGDLNVVVGYNGIGKSTMFKLLLQFYNPQKGNILLDDISISKIDRDFLMNNITYVDQDPFFFDVSIKENLKYANEKADDKKIIEVCKKVDLHYYIKELPDKYDTKVGEMGDNLSGGQKQRLAVARAIIKEPRIFLFDEPMVSIDGKTKDRLIKILKDLSKNHTVIIISHDLDVIKKADKIFLLDEGKVIVKGEHYKLLENNFTYKSLFADELVV